MFATYQRGTPTIAAEPLRGGIAGGLLLECPTESFVQTTDRSWKNSQARPRRLRPQAPNLRQYGRCPRDPLEVRASNHLMVAHRGLAVSARMPEGSNARDGGKSLLEQLQPLSGKL